VQLLYMIIHFVAPAPVACLLLNNDAWLGFRFVFLIFFFRPVRFHVNPVYSTSSSRITAAVDSRISFLHVRRPLRSYGALEERGIDYNFYTRNGGHVEH
jgi:hypothetical protein